MSGVKKTEINFLEVNYFKLKTVADFLVISLDEILNASQYLGLLWFWLPIARIIDWLPDWNLDPEEETEKLPKIRQKYIRKILNPRKVFTTREIH